MPVLIPVLPECRHINNVCAKTCICEKAVDTEIPEIYNPWGLLWKASPSTSSYQLQSCLGSGYINISSSALKKKKIQLDLRPQYLPAWQYTGAGSSNIGLKFHNSTMVFMFVSLHSSPRVFSTTAHTSVWFSCCNTAKPYQCTLASHMWKCIIAVHCQHQHLRNICLFLT